MTESEAIKVIKCILDECTESGEAVCYVTGVDVPALEIAINALEKCKEQDNSSETVEIIKKLAELEAKVYTYEKIIANSNFAPIISKEKGEL